MFYNNKHYHYSNQFIFFFKNYNTFSLFSNYFFSINYNISSASPYYQLNKVGIFSYKNFDNFFIDSPSIGKNYGILSNYKYPLAEKNYICSSVFSKRLSAILIIIDCLLSKNIVGLSIIIFNILVIS